MPRIDAHTVAGHRVLNLVYDLPPSGFNSEDSLNLHDVVGRCFLSDNPCRPQVSNDPTPPRGMKAATYLL